MNDPDDATQWQALCHGTAILRYARLSSGEPTVTGKILTGFAKVEEDRVRDPGRQPAHRLAELQRSRDRAIVIESLGR